MRYAKMNSNPLKNKSVDCVVRAISTATEKTWDEVYKTLCDIGFEMKDMPNSKPVYEKYLSKIGWSKQKMPKKKDGTKYIVNELDKNFKRPLIIQVANHLTCVNKDDELVDTWDCGKKSVYNYYTKEKATSPEVA